MNNNIIFVTGFFGAPIMQSAQHLAESRGWQLINLDAEIEKADGRSVRRICMMMGEHEYRNKEYEAIKKIADTNNGSDKSNEKGIIVCCGDGVLHDDMSKELIIQHELVIAGADMTCDELWENAKNTENSYHAFMHFGSEKEKHAAFAELYERQRALFMPYIIDSTTITTPARHQPASTSVG